MSMFAPIQNVLKFVMWSTKPDMLDIYEMDITGLTILDLHAMNSGKFVSQKLGTLVKTVHFKDLKIECCVFLDASHAAFYVADRGDYDDNEDEVSGYFQLSFKLMIDGKTPTDQDLSKHCALKTLNKALQSCE